MIPKVQVWTVVKTINVNINNKVHIAIQTQINGIFAIL